ncbi:TPA: 2-C-methyl-D-erythritol 2,4-cyclodiphosphate synthase [bacterium]|nr:2-C-methyl-D-erythritol 2,4-cyclodiphosphate synthase [bacterium]
MYKEDYYHILGVSRDASIEEIKAVYRKLVKEYHPDKGKMDEERIKEINEAYSVLSNPDKRIRYDLLNPVEDEEPEYAKMEGLEDEKEIAVEPVRMGIGFDTHPLVSYRKLFLGGVEIPYAYGLASHSDGDVLLHALCDALFGAIGEEGIGYHFPDTNPEYKDAASIAFLQQTAEILDKIGYKANNVDSVILAEKPPLSPYIPKMKENISKILGIPQEKIGIKAKTCGGLGYIGKKEGISAYVIVGVLPTRKKR